MKKLKPSCTALVSSIHGGCSNTNFFVPLDAAGCERGPWLRVRTYTAYQQPRPCFSGELVDAKSSTSRRS